MRILIVLIGLLAMSPGRALFADEIRSLTLEESIHMALENNPDISIAEKEVAKSRAELGEAYATILPSVDANAMVQHAWDIQTSTIPNFLKPMLEPLAPSIPEFADMPDFVEMAFGMENMVTVGLSLTQPLYLGGAGIAGIRLASAAQDASKRNMDFTKQNLIYRTARSFYGCLLAKELMRVQEGALEEAMANLKVVEMRYDVGSASGFDQMRAEVEVANLKPEVIASRNHYQSALTDMKTILGIDTNEEISILGKLEYRRDDLKEENLAVLQRYAFERRPDLQALQANKSMAEQSIALAKSGFLPKVFFSTDYSHQASRNDWDFAADDFSEGFTSAVSVQLPIFDGLGNVRKYQKARLDYRIVEDRERQLLDIIAAEVELAQNGLLEAEEKYQAARESIELAREALRLANLRYEEGASTQLDVLGSQLSLRRAELNNVSALYAYQMARYELRLVIGTLVNPL